MNCPDCGGAMWDNRDSKRSPKQPDYKCKNRQCDKAVWLEKRGAESNGNSNGNGNGNAAGYGNQPASAPHGNASRPLGPLYAACLDFAKKACAHHFAGKESPSDVIAAAATLFIQAVKDGAPIREAKPAPAPPPPPPPPVPQYAPFSDDSDLPF